MKQNAFISWMSIIARKGFLPLSGVFLVILAFYYTVLTTYAGTTRNVWLYLSYNLLRPLSLSLLGGYILSHFLWTNWLSNKTSVRDTNPTVIKLYISIGISSIFLFSNPRFYLIFVDIITNSATSPGQNQLEIVTTAIVGAGAVLIYEAIKKYLSGKLHKIIPLFITVPLISTIIYFLSNYPVPEYDIFIYIPGITAGLVISFWIEDLSKIFGNTEADNTEAPEEDTLIHMTNIMTGLVIGLWIKDILNFFRNTEEDDTEVLDEGIIKGKGDTIETGSENGVPKE
ncbi:hypothetical protein [Natronorubrum aibiense]|uniref:Uncharacterized protein n=1 Tax=Natronorubrum aibiense TaxID=348826 RepID=A0A5P9P860_9EURY|nr:hypothetical protein [Natronorubrum aibiense]QFU84296.1 hypothetical protein GCU68_17130 [Natronorubrum aibiense]